MQSRRHEDFAPQSPSAARSRDRRINLGPDHFMMPHSPSTRRSLSPRRVEGLQRGLGRDRRSSSLERRDYGWDLGGRRGDQVQSRSPPFGQLQKRPHYDEGITSKDFESAGLHRRHEFFEYMNADVDDGLRNEYGYKHGTSRAIRDDLDGSRLDSGGHGLLGQKSMVLEDGTSRGMYKLSEDLGPTSKYVEHGASISSTSLNLGLGRSKEERARFPDPLLLHKLSAMEPYGKGEKPMFHSRDASYPTLPASHSKDFMGTSQFKDFASTSSGNARVNFPGSCRDGMPLHADEYPRSSAKLTEPLAFSGYGQRRILDTGRDPEAEDEDRPFYGRDTFSPSRAERRDYLYPRPGVRGSDDRGYPSDELYRRMGLSNRVDYEHRNVLRPSMMDTVTEHVDNTEFSRRNPRERNLWGHPSLEKRTAPNYVGMIRSSAASKQGGEYLDSASAHVEFGRKVSREQEIPHLGVSRNREISRMISDYGFERDAGSMSQKERMRRSPEFQYETDMRRLSVRSQGMKADERDTYDPSDRMLKRKYIMDEGVNRHNSRRFMSSKWNNSSRTQDIIERDEEWIDQDASGSFLSKKVGYDHRLYRRMERKFDGANRHRVSASEDWLSSHDSVEHLQEYSIKPYKSGGKYLKGHSRPGSLNWNNSSRSNGRHVLPKPHNVWVRGRDDNQVDVHANNVEQSDDWVSSVRSEPPEDSEEFKQLVHKFFLSFSKKLNDNPVVRKRYKEQGRAGTLFCIVCGRSLSKEFMDTQRLVRHAFMSHKVGMRAQHLGLHKAICVLLGWNSVVTPDIVTWVPEAISSVEAFAQKEDLILWPPVIVIHNSSISDTDTEGRRVIAIETLGDFLRGKGFSGGKFKVCLGKPPNHGVMVVKFLGTFSGLQDAEKLHSYFAENKRGRRDFEQIASSKGKSSNSVEGEIQGNKVDELVLYGYMGIAEDLDKVDFDTKRKCSIKSKKEIQELADAPVKPE